MFRHLRAIRDETRNRVRAGATAWDLSWKIYRLKEERRKIQEKASRLEKALAGPGERRPDNGMKFVAALVAVTGIACFLASGGASDKELWQAFLVGLSASLMVLALGLLLVNIYLLQREKRGAFDLMRAVWQPDFADFHDTITGFGEDALGRERWAAVVSLWCEKREVSEVDEIAKMCADSQYFRMAAQRALTAANALLTTMQWGHDDPLRHPTWEVQRAAGALIVLVPGEGAANREISKSLLFLYEACYVVAQLLDQEATSARDEESLFTLVSTFGRAKADILLKPAPNWVERASQRYAPEGQPPPAASPLPTEQPPSR